MPAVLDASALLAWLQEEPGADVVERWLDDAAVISAVNWSEVLQKSQQHGRNATQVGLILQSYEVAVEPVIQADGEHAAQLWRASAPLSVGDRCCLAVAVRLGLPAVTADRAWLSWASSADVQVIR